MKGGLRNPMGKRANFAQSRRFITEFATPFHFQIHFSSIIGLYSQAETTSMITKARTQILTGVTFVKIFSEICIMSLNQIPNLFSAEVAAEFIMKRVEGVKVTPHCCRIEEKPDSFYRQFQLIITGLDSVPARRWMNAMVFSLLQYDENHQVRGQHHHTVVSPKLRHYTGPKNCRSFGKASQFGCITYATYTYKLLNFLI